MSKHSLDFYFGAGEAWQAMLEDCRQARQSIELEDYIFDETRIGRDFLDLLKSKAQEGVRVRVLLDMYGSVGLYLDSRRIEEIRSWGVGLRFYNPIALWRVDNFLHWVSRRDHRKLLLVDSRVAHLGSLGIAEHMRYWREACLRLESDRLGPLSDAFSLMWQSARQRKFKFKRWRAYLGSGLSYLASAPRVGRRVVHKELLRAIRGARRNILLVSPYFVPTKRLERALAKALQRGVKLKMLLPEGCDHHILDVASLSYTKPLARRGAEVFFHPDMVHAKYFVVDGQWGMVGSANLDNLSLLNDYEHEIAGENPQLVAALEKNFAELLAQAKSLDPAHHRLSFTDHFLALLVRPIHRFL